MNIEDRLRDAYRGAAETVRPETIRPFGGRGGTAQASERGSARFALRRTLTPLAAAAAVALVAALTTVVPHLIAGTDSGQRSTHRAGAGPAGRFLVTADGRAGTTLTVRNIATGARVASIAAPEPGMVFSGLATGDGRRYVATLWRPGHCRTWLYKFQMSGAGHPSRLAPYALPTVARLVDRIAVSEDGTTLAYSGERCTGRTADLSVFSMRSMRSRQWSLPGRAPSGSVSLTRDGTKLAYSLGFTKSVPSAVYILPTDSGPGAAVAHSTLVAAAARFGASDEINSAVITPAGDLVYFTTNRTGLGSSDRWQLRAADLATGRLRVAGRYAGTPGFLAADPSVGRIIAAIELSPATPSPVSSPSRTRVKSPPSSGSPVPSPSRTRVRLPTPAPSPSRSRVKSPTPIGSPVPSPSRTRVRLPTPTPSPSGPGRTSPRLAMIDLPTGSIRFLPWTALPGELAVFAW